MKFNVKENHELNEFIVNGYNFALIPSKKPAENFSKVGIITSKTSLYNSACEEVKDKYMIDILKKHKAESTLAQIISYTISEIDRYCFELLTNSGRLSSKFAESYVYGDNHNYSRVRVIMDFARNNIFGPYNETSLSAILFNHLVYKYVSDMPLVSQQHLIPVLNDATIFMTNMLMNTYRPLVLENTEES